VAIPRPLQKLDRNIVFACIQQGAFLVVGLLVHDGGMTVRSVLCSMLAYWMGVTFILSRHRHRPMASAADNFFIRWGFLMLWVILVLIAVVLMVIVPEK
jgi:hypothetical protein